MTAGIPHDMRRIALVSLVAHVVTLVALTTVPLTKIRSRGGSAIEVLLVSQPSAPVQVEQAPVPQPKPAPPSPPAPSKTAPTPPTVAKATRVPHVASLQKRLRTSEEIKKLLNTLPPPTPAMPSDATPATKELAPAVARAPQGTATVARPASVERCPPKARAYCPLLEAAINRVWNADTNPAVRQVLENAGDSTAAMRIVIQPNGEIGGIVLYKSSGNGAYDRAVESVLRELQRVPPLPDEMKGESFVAVTSFTYTKQ